MSNPDETGRDRLIFIGIWILWMAFLCLVFWDMITSLAYGHLIVLVITILPAAVTAHLVISELDEDR